MHLFCPLPQLPRAPSTFLREAVPRHDFQAEPTISRFSRRSSARWSEDERVDCRDYATCSLDRSAHRKVEWGIRMRLDVKRRAIDIISTIRPVGCAALDSKLDASKPPADSHAAAAAERPNGAAD